MKLTCKCGFVRTYEGTIPAAKDIDRICPKCGEVIEVKKQ
jgi:hypothetical protein